MMAKVRLAPAFVGSLDLGRDPELGEGVPHRALMWLLARVSAHVHHKHVLCLEGLLLARAGLPAAYELLLLPVDVLVVDVLPGTSPQRGMSPAAHPSRPHLVCADHPPHGPASTRRPRLLLSYLSCFF